MRDKVRAPAVNTMTLEAVKRVLSPFLDDVMREFDCKDAAALVSAFRSASGSTSSWHEGPVRRNRETASLWVTFRTEIPSISRIRSPS